MPRGSKRDNYFLNSADVANQKLNLAMRAREKVYEDFEVSDTREPEPTYQNMTAPTINPKRPRALKLAYSREAQKLVVRFRDGTWWEYNDIPVEMWNDLKSSNSTGRYLSASGLDQHDDMGPFDPNEMSEETRVLFNS